MASAFSFHCMICFEQFDAAERRFPVVLPCGHTYVCNQCANRLEKCMECRTPLFHTISPSTHAHSDNHPHNRNQPLNARQQTSRYHAGGRGSPARPTPPVKMRLPLPKNVVLMSLIEATEMAAENVRGQEQQPSLTESPLTSINPLLDVDDMEEEKIKTGTSLAISDCGTYAVAAREGLEIFPRRPETAFPNGQEESETDVDLIVRDFHMDSTRICPEPENDENILQESKACHPVKLGVGDRVQIVATERGWAKLARGYGFVQADGNLLVKVGSSVDRACKLEALLRLLSTRRKALKTDQMKVDNQFISLMNELQASLSADEDLTVIAAETFHAKPGGKAGKMSEQKCHVIDEEQRCDFSSRNELPQISTFTEDSTPLKPRPARPMTPPRDPSSGYFCAASDVLETVIPGGSGVTSHRPPALPSTTSTPAVAELMARVQSSDSIEYTPTRLLTPATHPSPGAMRAGARAWREMHGRQASAGVDFRTGMSGHTALMSSSAHQHDYLGGKIASLWGGLSNHTGLTMFKRKLNPPPAMPSFPIDDGSASPTSTRIE